MVKQKQDREKLRVTAHVLRILGYRFGFLSMKGSATAFITNLQGHRIIWMIHEQWLVRHNYFTKNIPLIEGDVVWWHSLLAY